MSPEKVEKVTKTGTSRAIKIDLMEQNWDYLIILDACRYDYFEGLYEDYLSGELKKRVSPGSSTGEWTEKTFQDKYDDVVYVSANPHINSKIPVGGFNAKKHFHKVIDAWVPGWDEELGTVLPSEVNGIVLDTKEDYPDKRLIIHYIQPHAPYLSLGPLGWEKTVQRKKSFRKKSHHAGSKVDKIKKIVGTVLRKFIGLEGIWQIKKTLRLSPGLNPMEAAYRKVGRKGLIHAYEENLRAVLEQVSLLCEKLPKDKKVVITADHGELLGENREYRHQRGRHVPILMEVPWFEVSR